MVAANHQLTALMVATSLGYFLAFYVISLVVSLTCLYLSIMIYIKATTKMDELEELRRNNLSVAVLMSAVVIGMALFIQSPVERLIGSLVNYEAIGRVELAPSTPDPSGAKLYAYMPSNSPVTAYKRMALPSAMPLIAIAAILLCCAAWTVKQLNERLSPMLASAPRGFTSWIAELISERLSPMQASALGGMQAESYVKSDHTNQTIRADRGRYVFSYVFRDHKQRDWRLGLGVRASADAAGHRSIWHTRAVPASGPGQNLRAGMVRLTNGTLGPDFAALIAYYKPYTRHLYDMAREATRSDSREELVRFLLAFVQDIPYGVPPSTVGKKMILGILTPPQVFVEGWGDCDTKSLLLATILAHDTSIGLLLISVPGTDAHRRGRNPAPLSADGSPSRQDLPPRRAIGPPAQRNWRDGDALQHSED